MSIVIPIRKEHDSIPGLAPEDQINLIHSPLMKDLPFDLQQELLSSGRIKQFKKGEHLFLDGDRIDTVYYVLSGKIKEYFCNSNGDDCLRRILVPGNYISLHQLFVDCKEYSYTSETLTPVKCFTWKKEDFSSLTDKEPALTRRLAQLISEYMENGCRLNCICRKTHATSRVAAYLLSKHKSHCRNSKCKFHKASFTTQVDIRPIGLSARDICLARETFSRALSSLQEQDIVNVHSGMVELIDLEGLKAISGVA